MPETVKDEGIRLHFSFSSELLQLVRAKLIGYPAITASFTAELFFQN